MVLASVIAERTRRSMGGGREKDGSCWRVAGRELLSKPRRTFRMFVVFAVGGHCAYERIGVIAFSLSSAYIALSLIFAKSPE